MKKLILIPVVVMFMISCSQTTKPKTGELLQTIDSSDMTNNFYDNTPTYPLTVNDLTVEGEIANPGKVDFSRLPVHSVIVKETLLDSSGSDRFVGAYRYDGYSLFDILNDRKLNKANAAEFNPIIDMYIEVENTNGEKVVFSWGEIYYPNTLHRILIASGVSRIVPSKSKDIWPLPEKSKIIAANDLVTERNISLPVKITVKSFPRSFIVNKALNPMFSEKIKLFDHAKLIGEIADFKEGLYTVSYNTIFYGRGRGIHSTAPFKGEKLAETLAQVFPAGRENLQKGIMCISGKDGYRCALSYSEVFNRNDQQEFLLVKTKDNEDGGLFRIFPASDFFSDRAIKSVSEIDLGF